MADPAPSENPVAEAPKPKGDSPSPSQPPPGPAGESTTPAAAVPPGRTSGSASATPAARVSIAGPPASGPSPPPPEPAPSAPVQAQASTQAPTQADTGRRKSGVTTKGGKGKGIPAADKKATELAGTLQTYFAHDDRVETSALKPLRRPKKIYENSFRLQPINPYSRDRVQKVMDTTLEEMMQGVRYQSDTANDIAVKISEKLRARILALKFDRYKIIVMTNVGPLNRQGLHIGFRCLWDFDRDSYNTASFKNPNAFCTAVVYGIYFE